MAKLLSNRWSGLVLFVACCFIPLLTDGYTQYLVNLVFVYILIAFGQQIILGFAGQFSFANAAFMGIGAYTVALLGTRLGISFWISLPVAGVLCALIGALVGLPALRLSRVYLALVTVAFGELVTFVLLRWNAVTLGSNGVGVESPRAFGYVFYGDKPIFAIILVVTALLVFVAKRLLDSHFGRAFVAIRENELVASCSGINIAQYKTIAFALSGFYAGVGGGLFALTLGYIVPEGYNLLQLVIHFSIVMVGGVGSFFGTVLGAALLTVLPELLRGAQAAQEMLFGALLIVFIVFMPRGVAGMLKRWRLLPPEILVRGWREEIGTGAGKRARFNVGSGGEGDR